MAVTECSYSSFALNNFLSILFAVMYTTTKNLHQEKEDAENSVKIIQSRILLETFFYLLKIGQSKWFATSM